MSWTRDARLEVVHQAICDDSPDECLEWAGDCVKAVAAIEKLEMS